TARPACGQPPSWLDWPVRRTRWSPPQTDTRPMALAADVHQHTSRRNGRRLSLPEERLLVRAARAGDPAAREQLVETFTPRIATVARIYKGSRGIDRAE